MTGQRQDGLWPARVRPVRVGFAGVGISTRIDLRVVLVTGAMAVLALVVGWYSMVTGTSDIGTGDIFDAITGQADENTRRSVMTWRLPRVTFALLGGAALAVSGAVFQSMTRNPLGSPDIIGFSSGAYTGALVVALLGIGGVVATPLGALAGGLITGFAVYLLAWRRGVSGMRIIIVGLGVGIFLTSLNTYLITTMCLEEAVVVAGWGAGNLESIRWMHVTPLVIVLVLVLPVLLLRARDMTMLEMGDDPATAIGVAPERLRILLLIGAVALVAVVTASAGPIAFVALAAPQVAMRLTGATSVQILPAAAAGALMLVASDLLARTLVEAGQLPVGIVTLCVGGAYLVWLLIGFGSRRKASR